MTPTSRFYLDKRSFAPVLLGAWAAAFAIAPSPQVKLLVAAPALLAALAWWTLLTPERWLAVFFFCALLLPPLPSPLGNSGIPVGPLVAFLGLLAGALRVTEWRRSGINQAGNLPILFVLFLAIILGSVAFAAVYSGWQIALGSLARVLLLGIGIYVFLYTLIGPRSPESDPRVFARFLFWIALAGAAFACIDFYFQLPAPAGYGRQFVWLAQTIVRRAQGTFYEASTLGNFCAFFLVMILAGSFPVGGQRVFSRFAMISGAIIFSAALIFSSSRASVVTVVVACIAFLYLRRLKLRRVIAAISAALTLAIVGVRFALPEFSINYWGRMAGSLQYVWAYPDGILSGRLTHWKTLVNFLMQHPWHLFFGIGYKTIPYTDYAGVDQMADNTYLSLLVETGIIGLTAFAVLNVAILRTAYRAARSNQSRASFFGVWMFCFWCGELFQMLTGDLITFWRVLPVYFWVLATAARESGA
jgi:O-antigen ligase